MYILHPTQVLGLNLDTFHINSPAAAATCQTGRVDEEEEATSQEMKLIIERLILLIFLSSASNDINKKETRLPSESNHLKRSGDLSWGCVVLGFLSMDAVAVPASCILYILRGLLLAIELSSIWPIDVCRLLLFCDVSQGQRKTKPRRCV